jgi:hypothetical protein
MIDEEAITEERLHVTQGLLEKAEAAKAFMQVKECRISILQISSEEETNKFIDSLISTVIGRDLNKKNNIIGLNTISKLIPSIENEKVATNAIIQYYNYIVAKKFKYIRNEAITTADKILVVVNIYDQRGIENIKETINEIQTLIENTKLNFKDDFITMFIKGTNNILAKMNEKSIFDLARQKIQETTIQKYIEIEENDVYDLESILSDIIYKF